MGFSKLKQEMKCFIQDALCPFWYFSLTGKLIKPIICRVLVSTAPRGHAATVNEGLIVQSSQQDLALGEEETIPALAQDLKPRKTDSAFRGSCPIARESCMSQSKAPLQCQP